LFFEQLHPEKRVVLPTNQRYQPHHQRIQPHSSPKQTVKAPENQWFEDESIPFLGYGLCLGAVQLSVSVGEYTHENLTC